MCSPSAHFDEIQYYGGSCPIAICSCTLLPAAAPSGDYIHFWGGAVLLENFQS